MHQDHFASFSLNEQILRAVTEEGYQTPTPIQLAAIPELLAGRDLVATAQTGTGKTAAFALPILHRLHERRPQGARGIRALILTPTRELALQIDQNLRAYGRHLALGSAVILGGVSANPQIQALRSNPEILVATPGRLLDLMNQGFVRLDRIEMLVLDEADRMLDMGFLPDVRRILAKLPQSRQTMLFSATMPKEIAALAADLLRNPAKVAITPPASVSVRIEQHVLFVEQDNKRDLLTRLIKNENIQRALVFTRTKHRANRIMEQLTKQGIAAEAIHSNKSQGARQRALEAFDSGRIRVLVATDIMARGIDVEGITHVINFELPNDPESYVHRIGRTARAGATGIAISFCCAEEVGLLKGIERLTKCPLTVDESHHFHSAATAALYKSHGASTMTLPRPESRRDSKPRSRRHFGRPGRIQRSK
jgi:ATP-dependent RNA helicase RhlE